MVVGIHFQRKVRSAAHYLRLWAAKDQLGNPVCGGEGSKLQIKTGKP